MNAPSMVNILRILIWLVAAPLLFGCEQARVDALMEELCQKDGGMKVYEKVELPEDQFNEHGEPTFYETWNKTSGGYRFVWDSERIKSDKPTLNRYEYSVVRERDKKLLGTYVVYLRIGGGLMWVPGPDPSKLCPSEPGSVAFLKNIFVKS